MANEDKRIIELPASESILNDDWIAKDSASQDTTRLQLSFLKQLCGGNNFAGEWHSGTVYNKDAYVTHDGKLYHNIKGGSVVAVNWTSSQWQEIDVSSELKKVVGSLAPPFDSSTNYDVDDLVTFNGALCKCISPHSAGAWNSSHFATVKVSSLLTYFIMDNFTDRRWEKYSGSPVNYTKGTVIHKGLSMYRCKANTTNQSWDSSKWEQVDVTDLINSVTVLVETVLSNIAPTFSSLAQYNINDFVIYNNELYICMKPHHGSWDPLDFDTGKIGDILKGIFNNIADVYNPSGSYVKGDVVNYVGIPLRCIVDTATSPMVFSEWEQVTVEQLIDEKVADVQIAGQTTVDENKISDLTSLAIEGTASGEIASFSDGSNLPMRSFICNIDAVQDLHGYDGPWVGGAGKNKLENNVTSQTVEPFTITRNSDGSLTINGTTTNNMILIGNMATNTTGTIGQNDGKKHLPNGSYIVSGSYYSENNGRIYTQIIASNNSSVSPSGSDVVVLFQGNGEVVIDDSYAYNWIRIFVGDGTYENLTIYPMIRLATETDPTYEPYENICPISGHTGVDAWVRGKNLAEDGFGWNVNADGIIESTALYNTSVISVRKNERYIQTIDGVIANIGVIAFYYERPSIGSQSYNKSRSVNLMSPIFTAPINGYAVVRNTVTDTNIQIEKGNTATSYEPYNPNSQTIQVSWQTEAGEVFGGYVDLVSGELTVTDGYIASYNGETLPSTWISDRDTYAEGTSPTTGAEVVYKLANPQTYQLTPTQIKSLLGTNNAWCDTGDVNVKYNKDATTIINSLIARIEALENA